MLACEEPAPERRTTARAPLAEESAPEAPLPTIPVAPAGETIESCSARLRVATPPEVHATLVDLGWLEFFSDACGAAIAVRDHSPEGCDALSARALRERCRLRTAIVSGDVSACPPARAGEGHDALCVAIASGQAALCRGTSIVEQPICEALLARDADRCARSPASEDRCRAQTLELSPLLPASPPETTLAIAEPTLTLTVRRVVPSSGGDVVGEPATVELGSLERGAVLVTEGGALRIVTGELTAHGREASMTLELELPASAALEDTVEASLALGTGASVELRLVDVDTLRGGRGEVVIDRLEPRLGGRLDGHLEVELIAAIGSVRVSGRFSTFVRDRSP